MTPTYPHILVSDWKVQEIEKAHHKFRWFQELTGVIVASTLIIDTNTLYGKMPDFLTKHIVIDC